jgi:hypothetical protein
MLQIKANGRKVNLVRELLRAWDPVAQKTVWEHETSSGIRGYDGGVMSTGRQSGVPGARQRRTVGLRRRYRQGAEGDQDRQPHHGGAHDLRRQRRAIRRGADRATAAPPSPSAPSRRAAPRSSTRTPTASSPSSSAAARCRLPPPRVDEPFEKPPAADRDKGADRRRRDQIRRGVLALPRAWGRASRRICAGSTPACMRPSRTSC